MGLLAVCLTLACLCVVGGWLQYEEATRLSADRLESQLHKVQQTIQEDKEKNMETPYALIIDGKALLYALSPRLRQLFLEVSWGCLATYSSRHFHTQPAHCVGLHRLMPSLLIRCTVTKHVSLLHSQMQIDNNYCKIQTPLAAADVRAVVAVLLGAGWDAVCSSGLLSCLAAAEGAGHVTREELGLHNTGHW